ncbi:Hypothetical protein UVM_LOCUS54 [uncultured virus]|nr:Hypothetical protein UVM_LOCUS54 [uncultured virus]
MSACGLTTTTLKLGKHATALACLANMRLDDGGFNPPLERLVMGSLDQYFDVDFCVSHGIILDGESWMTHFFSKTMRGRKFGREPAIIRLVELFGGPGEQRCFQVAASV